MLWVLGWTLRELVEHDVGDHPIKCNGIRECALLAGENRKGYKYSACPFHACLLYAVCCSAEGNFNPPFATEGLERNKREETKA